MPKAKSTFRTSRFNFDPDALSIERLGIQDGKLTLTDAASGGGIVLDKVWFNGEVRSLLGPFKGEGEFSIGGAHYPYRLSTGRLNVEGMLKLHLNVDPTDYPLSIETDGALSFAGGEPLYEGSLSLARPVGIASRSPDALVTQPGGPAAKSRRRRPPP